MLREVAWHAADRPRAEARRQLRGRPPVCARALSSLVPSGLQGRDCPPETLLLARAVVTHLTLTFGSDRSRHGGPPESTAGTA